MNLNKTSVREVLTIAAITLVIALGTFFFLIPSGVSVSSVSGLAMVISQLVPVSISALTLVINVILLILAWFLIDPEFCKRTVIVSILLPVYLAVLEHLFPNNQSITGDAFLDVLGYIFLIAWGISMLIQRNASSGGTDIIGKIMNKYLHMDLGHAISMSGIVIAASSVLVASPKIVFLSILGTYLQGMILDYFIFGMHSKKRICIMSEKEEEIKQFLLYDLHSGATIYNAIGAYNNEIRPEIVTIVDRSEYAKLMSFLSKVDPDAFVTVVSVKEVLYKPKR